MDLGKPNGCYRLLTVGKNSFLVIWSKKAKSLFSKRPNKKFWKLITFFPIFKPPSGSHQTRQAANEESLRILIKYTVCYGKNGFRDLEPTWFQDQICVVLRHRKGYCTTLVRTIYVHLPVHWDVYHPDLGPHFLSGPPNYSLPKLPSSS